MHVVNIVTEYSGGSFRADCTGDCHCKDGCCECNHFDGACSSQEWAKG